MHILKLKGFRLHTVLGMLLATFLWTEAVPPSLPGDTLRYQLSLYHPGKEKQKTDGLTLVELKRGAQAKAQFYMDVVSVYCSDSVCKIDTVRLFWNDIGTYMRYQLPANIYLEKAEGKKFNDEEYERLQNILMNKNSPFADLAIHEIVKTNDVEHGMEVDGYSGATVIELDETESVKGAALTCYTLWHWANGAVQDSIRKITGEQSSLSRLHAMLNGKKDAYKTFALEQLTLRKAYDEVSVQTVLKAIAKDEKKWLGLQIEYFEDAPDSVYFDAVNALLHHASKLQRIELLISLNNTDKEIPAPYYDQLSDYLTGMHSYREVDLFISLMESNGVASQTVIERILGLLNRNILIARRAYWFLDYQNLNASQKKTVNKFYKKNEAYL